MIRDCERGWPIRGIMMLRGFARTVEAMNAAESRKQPLPRGGMVDRVLEARIRRDMNVLVEYKAEMETDK